MAVKEVKYSRTFLSKTTQVDTSYHGSPSYVDCQKINEEDEKIREQAEKEFGFEVRHSQFGSSKEMFGSDGTMQYSFRFSGHPKEEEDRSKNIPYETEVHIRKSGPANKFGYYISDLERFLIEENFKEK